MALTILVHPLKSKKLQVTMLTTLGLIFLLSIAVYFDQHIERTYTSYTVYRTIFSFFNYTIKVDAIGEAFILQLQKDIHEKGYSIACGYAMNDASKAMHEVLESADKNMYINKHYIKSQI